MIRRFFQWNPSERASSLTTRPMNRPVFFALLIVTVWIAPLAPGFAQSPGAAQANDAARELYSGGDYEGAVTAYEKMIKDYPTDSQVPVAQAQLAFSYYFLARFDDALAILAKASAGPPLAPELKQIVDGFLPQILSAKAAAFPEKDPKRLATFNDAIQKFSAYITAYPKAEDLESAYYGRAIAEYQTQKYDDAVRDLETSVKLFPQSSTIASSKNLLAVSYATLGSMALTKGGDPAKAVGLYKKAADLLREIIDSRKDIALINEANFQLGEILFNQASFAPEAAKADLYKQAMEAYRAVKPKEDVLRLQREKVQGFPARRKAALLAKNQTLLKQLDKESDREQRKLAELEGKPDQTATALLKMGEIFFQQQNLNEARVVLDHVSPFLTSPEDQKRLLYFTTMTYALQNAADRAARKYNEFQSKYKGDPLADNLPVAMGNMYLGLNNAADAVTFFDESLAIYPNGRFAGLSVVSKAAAETKLDKAEKALATFQSFLAKNPPPEIGVIAQFNVAGIYKDTQRWDEAIAAYKTVRDKYPGTPQAAESEYWIAIATQQKGDNAAALPLLEAYVTASPKSPLAPIALYAKAGAQIALGKKEDGIATLADVAGKFPDSLPAPTTYFMRAQIRAGEGNAAEVIALMRQFIDKYPKDDKVFFAYDSIAQTAINSGQTDDGLAAYREFIQKYPESPQAPDALYKVADIQRAKAEAIGRYGALNDTERAQWKTLMDGSIASGEEAIQKYPDSATVALVLQTLLQDQRLLLKGELKKPGEVEAYLKKLADSAPTPAAKSKVLFALANYVSAEDPARALTIMTEAYKPEFVYSPQDMDTYGGALVNQQKLDEAAAVFAKLAKDYPIPTGAAPNQAPQSTQEAQAIALFGMGQIAQAKGQVDEAAKSFKQLKALYGWSPKVLEADYGIARSLFAQGKPDEALPLLVAIIRAPTATAELRAKSMLLGGDIMEAKWKAATDAKEKDDYLGAAIDYYIKIAFSYEGLEAASQGLWKGAQLLETQAAGLTDAKLKARQLALAKSSYEQLAKDFPTSPLAAKATERLAALGGK